MTLPRIAFIFTHQIQYFTNLLDELHCRGNLELLCLYAHRTQDLLDAGFGKIIKWDNRQDAGFQSTVLPGGWMERFQPRGTFRLSLFSALDAFNPDVIHLNGFSNAVQWQAWLWARLRNRKLVARGDGDTLPKLVPARRARYANWITHLFCRHVHHFFYQGSENRKYWLNRGACEDRMTWVPCVPDSRVYRQVVYPTIESRDKFRADLGIQPQDRVFVVSGKLDPRKRPQDALEALAKVKDARGRLWFVGSGNLEQSLRARAAELEIEKRVHFWGFQNQTQLPGILQAADVCVHPSEFDPWPYSVLECALSGQVLLLSDRTGSHPDLVGAVGGGITFSCGDVDDLAGKMSQFCSEDAMLGRFRDNLQAKLNAYTEATFCDIFEGVIGKLAIPAGGTS